MANVSEHSDMLFLACVLCKAMTILRITWDFLGINEALHHHRSSRSAKKNVNLRNDTGMCKLLGTGFI